jgi:adenosylcobinamide kinase/adenosylcobinamide-phosphate guanylyltransferase
MKRITLVTGGSRSGKSKHALELAASYNNKAFIATAEATDDEMRARIERHRRERDPSFHTWEEPVDLEMALKSLPEETEVAVLDCITVWLGNLFYREKITDGTCPEIAFSRPRLAISSWSQMRLGWGLFPRTVPLVSSETLRAASTRF